MNALEPGQITAMKDGNELILTVQSQAQEDIRISFELRGFAQSLTLMDK
jgi:invasion protein IalB